MGDGFADGGDDLNDWGQLTRVCAIEYAHTNLVRNKVTKSVEYKYTEELGCEGVAPVFVEDGIRGKRHSHFY